MRSTCIICGKKRIREAMLDVGGTHLSKTSTHYICAHSYGCNESPGSVIREMRIQIQRMNDVLLRIEKKRNAISPGKTDGPRW